MAKTESKNNFYSTDTRRVKSIAIGTFLAIFVFIGAFDVFAPFAMSIMSPETFTAGAAGNMGYGTQYKSPGSGSNSEAAFMNQKPRSSDPFTQYLLDNQGRPGNNYTCSGNVCHANCSDSSCRAPDSRPCNQDRCRTGPQGYSASFPGGGCLSAFSCGVTFFDTLDEKLLKTPSGF